MRYEYKTENTCSQLISFDINENIVTGIELCKKARERSAV